MPWAAARTLVSTTILIKTTRPRSKLPTQYCLTSCVMNTDYRTQYVRNNKLPPQYCVMNTDKIFNKQGILGRSTTGKWLKNNLQKTVYSVVTYRNLS